MNRTSTYLCAFLQTCSLVLLVSDAYPSSAVKADFVIGNKVENWIKGGSYEVCYVAEPVPQLLISRPLDWHELFTTEELHLLRDPLNLDARFLDLCEVHFWIRSDSREQLSTESLLILAHFDPLGREYPPRFGTSSFRNKDVEDERRKFFWSKRVPVPTTVYPTLFSPF